MRLFLLATILFGTLAACGYGVYALMRDPSPEAVAPPTMPTSDALPSTEQFAEWARTDPVRMLSACLARYERETSGFRALVEKRERANGELHPIELVRVAVRERPVAVAMTWVQGARPDFLGVKTVGVVYPHGKGGTEILAWRPQARFAALRETAIDAKGSFARAASRYCIKDAGFLPTMLRTYRSWEQIQKAGEMRCAYRGLLSLSALGGRPCHVLERTCPRRELDGFSIDEAPSTDPKRIEREGFDSVTVMIDAETWIMVGAELKRADGELVGSYYFRDVELNPSLTDDSFIAKAVKLDR